MTFYGGAEAQYICPRCHMRINYSDAVVDPNNNLHVCKDCQDVFDPWRKPARKTENIALEYPRRDDDLVPDPAFPETLDDAITGQY